MGNRRIGLRLTSYQLVVRTYTLNAHLVNLPTGDQPAPRSRKKNMARILLQPRAIPFVSGIRSTDTGVNNGSRTRTMTFTVSCANRYTISTIRLAVLRVLAIPRLVI